MARVRSFVVLSFLIIVVIGIAVYAMANYPQPQVDHSPQINSVNIDKHPELGMASVLVNATDDKGVAGVLVDSSGVNQSMINLAKDLYGFNITMGVDPANLTVKVYAKDTVNQTVVASKDLTWTPRDGFVTSAYLSDHSPEVAGLVYDNLPGIFNYTLGIWPTVDAIDNVLYRGNLLLNANETDVWINGIVPAINYSIVALKNSGQISILTVGPQSGNSTLDNQLLGQALFPLELTKYNMTSNEISAPSLKILLYNVTPNPVLNDSSPQVLAGATWRAEVTAKGDVYKGAMSNAGVGNAYGAVPGPQWPNSYVSYKNLVNKLYTEGVDIPLFIKGRPYIVMGEQLAPMISVLMGREFGYPTVFTTARYPSGSGLHTDCNIWVPKYKTFFGFWSDMNAFLQDYKGTGTTPELYRAWASGTETVLG